MIEELQLLGAALTPIPANKATLGTATSVDAGCPGSLCMQLSKQVNRKVEEDKLTKKEEKIEEKRVTEDKKDHITSLESISGKIDTVLKKLTNKTDPEEEPDKDKTPEEDVNLKKKLKNWK